MDYQFQYEVKPKRAELISSLLKRFGYKNEIVTRNNGTFILHNKKISHDMRNIIIGYQYALSDTSWDEE